MRLLTWSETLGRPECPYLRRWAVNFGLFSVRLHRWYGSDDHRAFHDHSWWFVTLVLKGGYTDVSPAGRERMGPGRTRYRPARHRHTVEVDPGGCWTLMLTGRKARRWGFYPRGRFVKANKYFLEHGHHPCPAE